MRLCAYARVSMALKQDVQNQFEPLLGFFASGVHEMVKDQSHPSGIWVDEVSSKDTRPKKEQILKLMRTHQADGVVFVALDRWGRTMSELVFEMEEFGKSGQCLISLKEGLDLSTAAGRLMGNVLAAMANFERDRNHERTMLGLARASAQGKIGGRHPKDCGCGVLDSGGRRHNGSVKPIRDASNRFVGWQKQTPSAATLPFSEQPAPNA